MAYREIAARVAAFMLVAIVASGTAVAAAVEPRVAMNDDDKNLAEIIVARDMLAERYPDSFGGIWIDADGVTTRIAMHGNDVAGAREMARHLLTRSPSTVAAADFSLSELHAVYEELVATAGQSMRIGEVDVASIGVNVQANRVEMIVIESPGKAVETLASQLHPSVAVTTTEERSVGNCANSNCPNPLKAGLKGYRSSSFACMMGFIMQSGSNYYWATAGHCNSGASGWRAPTETWQHPAGTNRGAVAYHGWYNNSSADISLVAISASQRSNKLCIYPTCSVSSITSRQATQNEVAGQSACAARQDGISCGALHSWPYTISICKAGGSDCRTIRELRRSSIITLPGDSGGPVYRSSNTQAVGSVSARYPGTSNTVYSQMHVFEGQSGTNVKITSD